MKNNLIKRLEKIKEEEENFINSHWRNIHFVPNDLSIAHISEIKFDDLNGEDLLRIFEYLILTRNRINLNNHYQPEAI